MVYYPNYLYADNALADKYLADIFSFFRAKWFNNKEVKNHYLAIIEILNSQADSEKMTKKNAHLKHLIKDNKAAKISEYLLLNLKNNVKVMRYKNA